MGYYVRICTVRCCEYIHTIRCANTHAYVHTYMYLHMHAGTHTYSIYDFLYRVLCLKLSITKSKLLLHIRTHVPTYIFIYMYAHICIHI